ncbi:MAG TPA: PAS domain S-box protein [Candidatus Nitrosocosmicus sp.]|nr:PAS domain S-box protein [Candidatus Nitrosocosmicus sp.]
MKDLNSTINLFKLSQDSLAEAIIDSSDDAIFCKDIDGFVLSWNRGARNIYGYTPKEMIGKHISILFPDNYKDEFPKLMKKLKEGKRLDHYETVRKRKDGSLVNISLSLSPIKDEEGKVVAVAVIGRDITHKISIEKKLKDAYSNLENKVQERTLKFNTLNIELDRSNRELEDFASVASHDLQEPLRKIQAFGDRLKIESGDQLSEKGKDYLERMQNAASRMQILINDLLAYARVTTKSQPFKVVDLNKIANEVVSDLEITVERTKAQIIIGELTAIEADALQMRQLFQNLIANSLKFRKENKNPTINISCKECNKNSIELIFEDDGIGFEQKYADRIFHVFQRLHGQNEYEGTGVGLAVCRKIVDRHHGSIKVKSSPDKGATFIVKLPKKQKEVSL